MLTNLLTRPSASGRHRTARARTGRRRSPAQHTTADSRLRERARRGWSLAPCRPRALRALGHEAVVTETGLTSGRAGAVAARCEHCRSRRPYHPRAIRSGIQRSVTVTRRGRWAARRSLTWGRGRRPKLHGRQAPTLLPGRRWLAHPRLGAEALPTIGAGVCGLFTGGATVPCFGAQRRDGPPAPGRTVHPRSRSGAGPRAWRR
jgi:hypothetical protein